MSSYVGGRIVPKHCGEWDSANSYEALSIVLYSATGDSYMARKTVPTGTDIADTDYWAICTNYSAQIAAVESTLETLTEQTARTDTITTSGIDFNDIWLKGSGVYDVTIGTATNAPVSNARGTLINVGRASDYIGMQIFFSRVRGMGFFRTVDSDGTTFGAWTPMFDYTKQFKRLAYYTNGVDEITYDADTIMPGWYFVPTDQLDSWSNLPSNLTSGVLLMCLHNADSVTAGASLNAIQLCVQYAADISEYNQIYIRHSSGTTFSDWVLISGAAALSDGDDLNDVTGYASKAGWLSDVHPDHAPFYNAASVIQNINAYNGGQYVVQKLTGLSKSYNYAEAQRSYYGGEWGDWHIQRDRPYNPHKGFVVVGDSLSSGYIQSSGDDAGTFYELSWAATLANRLGCTYYISGKGGISTENWLNTNNAYGISFFKRLPTVPLYFIGLGANDYNQDIGIDTYLSNYQTIISTIKEVQPNAVVLCCRTYRNGGYLEYDEALVEMIESTYEMDTDYVGVFSIRDEILSSDIINQIEGSHFTTLGYHNIGVLAYETLLTFMSAHPAAFSYQFADMMCETSSSGYPSCY